MHSKLNLQYYQTSLFHDCKERNIRTSGYGKGDFISADTLLEYAKVRRHDKDLRSSSRSQNPKRFADVAFGTAEIEKEILFE